MYIILYIFYR